MTNASRDENSVPTLIAALNTDGTGIVRVQVNASNHAIKASDGTTGTDFGVVNARHDENGVPTLLAVSSSTTTVNGISYVQGITPVEVYADASGYLLIDSM